MTCIEMPDKSVGRMAQGMKVADLIKAPLKIPVYQRPYTWKQHHVLQLLDDLKDAMDSKQNMYLVGTIILSRPDPAKEG